MKTLILYFSGTGNTKFIGEKIYETLLNRDYEVDIKSVETFAAKKLKFYDLLIIGYPVYGYAMPPFLENDYNKSTVINNKIDEMVNKISYFETNDITEKDIQIPDLRFFTLLLDP